MSAHVALMSVPLHGHVNPMLGLARELVDRGHRVTFVTGTQMLPVVAETGADTIGYDSTFSASTTDGGSWLPADDDGTLAVAAFDAERQAALAELPAAFASDVPDAVVYDTVSGFGPVLARAWQVPEIGFSPTHALPAARPSIGHGSGRGKLSDVAPCIVSMPRDLQHDAAQVGEQHHFVGPIQWRRSAGGRWSPPVDRRLAYLSLGTTYNARADLHSWTAAALERQPSDGADPWHLLIATGRQDQRSAALPTTLDVQTETWVPQQDVLEHAQVFVSSGGTGSVLESLGVGVPLVVLPQAVEHFLTAQRVAELGLGVALAPDAVSVDSLARAIEHVTTSDDVRTRVAEFARQMAATPGAAGAADLVDHVLSTRGGVAP